MARRSLLRAFTSLSAVAVAGVALAAPASATTLTNSSGQASNTLTLGNVAGLTTVTATIPGSGNVTSTFSARAISSASIASLSGDNQAGPAGTVLQPFVLQVVSGGQSAPGVTVDWTVLQGGGTLASATTISDASGHASNTLTLGSAAGVNVVRAKLTQQDIADRVGSSREMVNRIMKELTVGGYVALGTDKQIAILKKLPAAW